MTLMQQVLKVEMFGIYFVTVWIQFSFQIFQCGFSYNKFRC